MLNTASIKKQIQIGEETICYDLVRKNVKNINLRIRANCSIVVSAHSCVSEKVIDEFVSKKSSYILSSLSRFRELQKYSPTKKEYVSGESFYLLGKNIRLKVLEDEQECIYSDGVYLYLTLKNKKDLGKKEKMVNDFLDSECLKHFEEIVGEMFPIFQKYGVAKPILRIRNMETRWGSCLPQKGIITLNKRLIEAPKNCIEYVVLHEFCHFLHPNHSKQFYSFVAMLMPDWKERKKVLEAIDDRNC